MKLVQPTLLGYV